MAASPRPYLIPRPRRNRIVVMWRRANPRRAALVILFTAVFWAVAIHYWRTLP